MFGPNASLDISGSFYASTADYLQLGEGGRFDASQPDQTVLSVSAPSAFGFMGENAAGITVDNSKLAVDTGKSFGLIGGDLSINCAP